MRRLRLYLRNATHHTDALAAESGLRLAADISPADGAGAGPLRGALRTGLDGRRGGLARAAALRAGDRAAGGRGGDGQRRGRRGARRGRASLAADAGGDRRRHAGAGGRGGFGRGGLALSGSLGWQPLLTSAALVVTAGVYSQAWRGSLSGAACFALAAVLIPLGAALVGGPSGGALWWVGPVGAATGLAFFVVYKLPDFERDDEDGSRSVLHWAGIDAAVPTAWAAVALALALALSSINLDGYEAAWVYAPLVWLLSCALGTTIALLRQVTEQRLWWQRALLCPGLLALMVGWLGAMSGA